MPARIEGMHRGMPLPMLDYAKSLKSPSYVRDIMIESAAYDIIKEEGFREGSLETARRMVLEVLQE
ncbi:TPA: hypothetical protein ENG04_02350, partial [Candidatus Poribacteria bacterium]|nr:hypothetical protein [Candidatus Poribacteria bacterium]HEX28905.1 hypothetical protein [Candidatus Poribacteria bacterium]